VTITTPQKNNAAHSASSTAARDRIFGTGEMADLTRAYDWSNTPVGDVAQWPETLLVTVNTMLSSRHPMFLWWGKDLVQFYNDGYRPSIREDKHPSALGQRGEDCWPEIWPIIGPQIDAVMTRGEASWHEDQLVPINRNGRLEDVYWTYGYSPVRNSDGEICGTLVVCTETTDSVLGRLQLQQERERLADLFQQASAFFAVLGGPNHVFEMINPLYQELIGPRSINGKSVREAVPEAEEQGFIAILDEVYRTGEPFIGRNTPIQLARNASQSLELRYLDFVYQPRRDASENVSGIIVLGVDVTENRLTEQALIQSEKLAVVGRLASSIAHEINNPLESVTNLLYLAQHAAISPLAKEYLTAAEIELQRVSAIANQTLRFHRQTTNQRRVTFDDLINSTLPIFQGRLNNSHIAIERSNRTTHPVLCFDGEIRQVLSNLIGNATDAMNATGGRLLIRSREGTHWATGRAGVFLTVADTGPGMSPETLSQIFEPFFTTKGISGTGLGLWISHEIVDRHHGTLRVRSSQSPHYPGTVFTLFLPCD
jgi:signal transduction histidine kinase